MSLHLLRTLPAITRTTACLRFPSSSRLLCSAQPALQPLPDNDHDHLTSSAEVDSIAEYTPQDTLRLQKYQVTKESTKAKGASGSRPHKDPLEPTGVDRYLARLQSEGLEPTLADLDKCRPSRYPAKYSPQYVEAYNALADTLCRSFSRAQLQRFAAFSGLLDDWKRKSKKKLDFAEAIIEKRWNWPSLEEVERVRRDRTEVLTESMCFHRNNFLEYSV
jgi:hypothetical protein